jgi:hypothetical protein
MTVDPSPVPYWRETDDGTADLYARYYIDPPGLESMAANCAGLVLWYWRG